MRSTTNKTFAGSTAAAKASSSTCYLRPPGRGGTTIWDQICNDINEGMTMSPNSFHYNNIPASRSRSSLRQQPSGASSSAMVRYTGGKTPKNHHDRKKDKEEAEYILAMKEFILAKEQEDRKSYQVVSSLSLSIAAKVKAKQNDKNKQQKKHNWEVDDDLGKEIPIPLPNKKKDLHGTPLLIRKYYSTKVASNVIRWKRNRSVAASSDKSTTSKSRRSDEYSYDSDDESKKKKRGWGRRKGKDKKPTAESLAGNLPQIQEILKLISRHTNQSHKKGRTPYKNKKRRTSKKKKKKSSGNSKIYLPIPGFGLFGNNKSGGPTGENWWRTGNTDQDDSWWRSMTVDRGGFYRGGPQSQAPTQRRKLQALLGVKKSSSRIAPTSPSAWWDGLSDVDDMDSEELLELEKKNRKNWQEGIGINTKADNYGKQGAAWWSSSQQPLWMTRDSTAAKESYWRQQQKQEQKQRDQHLQSNEEKLWFMNESRNGGSSVGNFSNNPYQQQQKQKMNNYYNSSKQVDKAVDLWWSQNNKSSQPKKKDKSGGGIGLPGFGLPGFGGIGNSSGKGKGKQWWGGNDSYYSPSRHQLRDYHDSDDDDDEGGGIMGNMDLSNMDTETAMQKAAEILQALKYKKDLSFSDPLGYIMSFFIQVITSAAMKDHHDKKKKNKGSRWRRRSTKSDSDDSDDYGSSNDDSDDSGVVDDDDEDDEYDDDVSPLLTALPIMGHSFQDLVNKIITKSAAFLQQTQKNVEGKLLPPEAHYRALTNFWVHTLIGWVIGCRPKRKGNNKEEVESLLSERGDESSTASSSDEIHGHHYHRRPQDYESESSTASSDVPEPQVCPMAYAYSYLYPYTDDIMDDPKTDDHQKKTLVTNIFKIIQMADKETVDPIPKKDFAFYYEKKDMKDNRRVTFSDLPPEDVDDAKGNKRRGRVKVKATMGGGAEDDGDDEDPKARKKPMSKKRRRQLKLMFQKEQRVYRLLSLLVQYNDSECFMASLRNINAAQVDSMRQKRKDEGNLYDCVTKLSNSEKDDIFNITMRKGVASCLPNIYMICPEGITSEEANVVSIIGSMGQTINDIEGIIQDLVHEKSLTPANVSFLKHKMSLDRFLDRYLTYMRNLMRKAPKMFPSLPLDRVLIFLGLLQLRFLATASLLHENTPGGVLSSNAKGGLEDWLQTSMDHLARIARYEQELFNDDGVFSHKDANRKKQQHQPCHFHPLSSPQEFRSFLESKLEEMRST